MHDGARAFIADQAARLGPFRRVLEIGSRDVNGSIRQYFPGAEYLGVDKVQGAGVDVVADVTDGWKPKGTPDCIVCCEVFEHEPKWPAILSKASQWLAPGGVLLLTMATYGRAPHSAIDGGMVRPHEYYDNVRTDDLVAELIRNGFDISLDERNPGDLYAVGSKP